MKLAGKKALITGGNSGRSGHSPTFHCGRRSGRHHWSGPAIFRG